MMFWLNMILTDSYSWICCSCGLPHFEQYTFGNYSLDLSNSFDPLVNLTSGNVSDESDILAGLN